MSSFSVRTRAQAAVLVFEPVRAIARSAVFVAALASAVSAHDFWIVPSSFHPDLNTRLSIDLQVGEHWIGESVSRNPDKIARFFMVGVDGKDELVAGIDGKAPAGLLRIAQPGLVWIGYRSKTTPIELAAEKFEAYLASEGLERVSEARKSRGESTKAGKEIYSRCAKSLICAGKDDAAKLTGFDHKLGLTLELVPDVNPYALKAGDELPLHLLYMDKPLEGALVGCMEKNDAEDGVRVRTDAQGRVRFTPNKNGTWLVRVVHMIPAPPESGADWESLWGSLTFELGASAPAKAGK